MSRLALSAIGLAGALLLVACDDPPIRFHDAGPDADVDASIDAPMDAAVGRPGVATVSGAVKAASPSYRLYGTLRSGDGSSASPGYQRRGGVIGATQ